MKIKPVIRWLCGSGIAVLCVGAGIDSGNSKPQTSAPLLDRMTILEVDQFYAEQLNPKIFTNTLWVEQTKNEPDKYEFFATRPQHALGKGSGCGGHGCNLQKGERVGAFKVKHIKNLKSEKLFTIKQAEGDMSMLEDRLCTWAENGAPIFTCSMQTPLRATDERKDATPPLYTFRLTGAP